MARDIPVSAFFKRVLPDYPTYPHLCMLKIAYSGLLNTQIARTVIFKLYFSPRRWPGLGVAGHGTELSPGAGSPAPASAPSPAGGVRGSSVGRTPFSPTAGAGAAGAGGGAGGAGAALLSSSPLLTRLLQGWSERSSDSPSKPTMSP